MMISIRDSVSAVTQLLGLLIICYHLCQFEFIANIIKGFNFWVGRFNKIAVEVTHDNNW